MCHFGTTGKEEEKRHSAVGRRRRGKKKEKRRNSIAVGASLPSGRVPSFFPEIKREKKRRSAAEILFYTTHVICFSRKSTPMVFL